MTVADATSLGAALAARYTLEHELGRGGMATVYLARDLRHDRLVALKVLHPELGASLGPERFQREIRLAARLTHPHILPVLESGEAAGRLWYAMPYVEGETLRARLGREAQLGVAEAVALATQVAGALGYAHGQGVVHRDIKPENILLRGDQALVADFGIAKLVEAGGEPLTATGLSLGTPAYMSPEQGSGGRVDARSDVYALGCVVYEMLAGAPPFTGPTAQAILARHAVDPVPPLRTVRAQLPPAVERAVARALAKVPADRYASAEEFAAALEAGPVPAARARWSAVRIVAAVVFLVAGALGLWALEFRRPPGPPLHPSASAIAVLPLATAAADTALTRLGRDLAFTISASLDGVGGIETADRFTVASATADRTSLSATEAAALTRRLGAGSLLRGTLVRAGDHVRIDLGLYATDGLAPLAEGISASAHRDSIGPLTDSVAWALLRQIWQHGEPPSPSLAAVTTRSLPALRAFLNGEHALAANRWEDAALAFRGAIAADSTFWLSYFRYAMARWWNNQPVEEPRLVQALHLHQQVLPERERLLVKAFLTPGDSMDLRIERHRQVTEQFPDYSPGWFLYGDALYHFGSERGYDWTEAVEAFRRAVALNPELTPAWLHMWDATLGKDAVEAERIVARLAELGWPPPRDLFDSLLLGVARAGGVLPVELMRLADSLTRRSVAVEASARSGFLGLRLLQNGFPVAQLQINELGLRSSRLSPLGKAALEAANAWAWAARGRWDSALTIMTRTASRHRGVTGPRPHWHYIEPHPVGSPLALQTFELAVIGAWLGALPPGLPDERRPGAVAAVVELPDEYTREQSLGRLAWLDGILGFVREDRAAIRRARENVARSGYYQAALADRSLAAFDRALKGERTRAGHELAALDMECLNRINCTLFTPHIAVHRLAASQWLAEGGDAEKARRLLRWHDAEASYWPPALWTLIFALGGPNYLARARLEEAVGDSTRAREYYRHFLRRYDQPMPSQRHLVEEATTALARLSGEP